MEDDPHKSVAGKEVDADALDPTTDQLRAAGMFEVRLAGGDSK